MQNFEIVPTQVADLEFIHWLFEEAIAYQRKKGFPVWNGYDKMVLQKDIALKRQYKIIMHGEIACIFSILDADELIWRQKETGNAVYLHRIVVNPKLKGQNHFQKILDWSITYAIAKNKIFIRMDTWGDNPNILSYYKTFGFYLIEYYTTSCATELPVQNRNLNLALLERKVNS